MFKKEKNMLLIIRSEWKVIPPPLDGNTDTFISIRSTIIIGKFLWEKVVLSLFVKWKAAITLFMLFKRSAMIEFLTAEGVLSTEIH